jgi:hypothetical protein
MYDTPLAKRNSILVVAVSARIGAATTGRVTAKGSRERIPCSTLKLRPHTSLYCQDKGFVLQNMSHSNQGPPHTAMWLCASQWRDGFVGREYLYRTATSHRREWFQSLWLRTASVNSTLCPICGDPTQRVTNATTDLVVQLPDEVLRVCPTTTSRSSRAVPWSRVEQLERYGLPKSVSFCK